MLSNSQQYDERCVFSGYNFILPTSVFRLFCVLACTCGGQGEDAELYLASPCACTLYLSRFVLGGMRELAIPCSVDTLMSISVRLTGCLRCAPLLCVPSIPLSQLLLIAQRRYEIGLTTTCVPCAQQPSAPHAIRLHPALRFLCLPYFIPAVLHHSSAVAVWALCSAIQRRMALSSTLLAVRMSGVSSGCENMRSTWWAPCITQQQV